MTQDSRMILNLGAGNAPVGDAVNHDRVRHRHEIDVEWDLNKLPWPWPDDRFDHIIAKAVLEHLDCDLVASLGECWRILRPGGSIFLKLPLQCHESYDDPTHRWFYTLHSLDQFDPETRRGKTYNYYALPKRGEPARLWKILSVEYNKGVREASTSIIAKLRTRKGEGAK